jgi:putative resolvase
MELLRLSRAARRLGVHPVTLRLCAGSGKIPVARAGRERRFPSGDIGRRARFAAGRLRRLLAASDRYLPGGVR